MVNQLQLEVHVFVDVMGGSQRSADMNFRTIIDRHLQAVFRTMSNCLWLKSSKIMSWSVLCWMLSPVFSGIPQRRLRRRWTVSAWCFRRNRSQLPPPQTNQCMLRGVSEVLSGSSAQWVRLCGFFFSQCDRNSRFGCSQPAEKWPPPCCFWDRQRLCGWVVVPCRP